METAKTISKIRVTYPPLQDEFCKYGDKFEKIAHNEANGMYCYKRTPINRKGEPVYYEVFKAPKAKDENGNTYGSICIRGDCEHTTDKIAFYMANGFDAGRYKPKH